MKTELYIPLRDKIVKVEWKPAVGYESFYEVSSDGQVRSMTRRVNKAFGDKEVEGRILKQLTIPGGYRQVSLSVRGVRTQALVHRMVAKAFIKNTFSKRTVNHMNSKRDDNRVSNLEWATHKENVTHAYYKGNGARTRDEEGKFKSI